MKGWSQQLTELSEMRETSWMLRQRIVRALASLVKIERGANKCSESVLTGNQSADSCSPPLQKTVRASNGCFDTHSSLLVCPERNSLFPFASLLSGTPVNADSISGGVRGPFWWRVLNHRQ